MPKRPAPVPRHRQSISTSTRFRRLPVWVSKADIVAYFRLSPTDAQALFDRTSRRCLIDGIEKISKYQLQTFLYSELIRVMQHHPWCDPPRCTTRSSLRVYCDFANGKVLSELELWQRGLLS